MVHAGGVGSKYHECWAGRLPHIQAQLQLAAAGERAVVSLPGLTRLGTRQSWHGVAEVRAQEMTYSSMAHATSLGKTVAASALCGPWPERVFRFTIDASGDVLTITRAEEHRRREASPAPQSGAQPAPAQRQEKSQSISRAEPTGGGVASGMDSDRQSDIDEFYRILDQLAATMSGPRHLRECTDDSGCPPQGVYFFFEDGEKRADGSPRVVRVGTHALTATSTATLWGRLRQHRGQLTGRNPGGGNHRASVFRRHVGAALIRRDNPPGDLLPSWLDRHRPPGQRASQETSIERAVSRHIVAMPLLWLNVPARADRGYLESNSIALLSCLTGSPDRPSTSWLGHYAERAEIRESGLWNIQHVTAHYEPGFLRQLAQLLTRPD